MKKYLLCFIFFGSVFCVNAQAVLPYYTGFDNAAEKAGWVQFRKGWTGSGGWGIAPNSGFSPPSYLGHDYPIGASVGDTTIDWYVSPQFDFSSGAKIDSLKINVYTTGSVSPADHIGIYLLETSNDPSLSNTIIPLADLTNMHENNYYWKDTGLFIIPARINPCYIGIKYKAVQNIFTVKIDNIYIGLLPIGITYNSKIPDKFFLFPNPAGEVLTLQTENEKLNGAEVFLFNCFGQKISGEQTLSKTKDIDISFLPEGMYIVQISNDKLILREKFLISRK